MTTDPKTGRFLTGNIGGPGRPIGARNKLGTAFIAAMQEDFELHGKATVEQVRAERPHEYLKIVASLLPKELHLRDTTLDEMTNDEIGELLATIRAIRAGQGGATAPEPVDPAKDPGASRH